MNKQQLAEKLKSMYENADKGYLVAMIHLFGIKYSDYIGSDKVATAKEIVKLSRLSSSYHTEVSKGVKLSKFVTIK